MSDQSSSADAKHEEKVMEHITTIVADYVANGAAPAGKEQELIETMRKALDGKSDLSTLDPAAPITASK